jgi:hypothetical protein
MDVKSLSSIVQMNRGHFSIRNLLVPVPLSSIPSAPKKQSSKKRGKKEIKATSMPLLAKKPKRKAKISAALREQVWLQHAGRVFETKCLVTWCTNKITVFDFQCGHDIPESKGGPTNITNLYPICGKCNLSMSNTYTFKEWCKLYVAVPEALPLPSPAPPSPPKKRSFFSYFSCFTKKP